MSIEVNSEKYNMPYLLMEYFWLIPILLIDYYLLIGHEFTIKHSTMSFIEGKILVASVSHYLFYN